MQGKVSGFAHLRFEIPEGVRDIFWVSTSRTICTKVLRGNPKTIGSDIGFSPGCGAAWSFASLIAAGGVYGILIHVLQEKLLK
jgi:hypothetical protein